MSRVTGLTVRHRIVKELNDTVLTYDYDMPGYVSINCETTGLSDNTQGHIGQHVIYLRHAERCDELIAHPQGRALLAAAHAFVAKCQADSRQTATCAADLYDWDAWDRENDPEYYAD